MSRGGFPTGRSWLGWEQQEEGDSHGAAAAPPGFPGTPAILGAP